EDASTHQHDEQVAPATQPWGAVRPVRTVCNDRRTRMRPVALRSLSDRSSKVSRLGGTAATAGSPGGGAARRSGERGASAAGRGESAVRVAALRTRALRADGDWGGPGRCAGPGWLRSGPVVVQLEERRRLV